jgi:RNA polymerase sigma-70 factor, ECF subfamily
MEPPARTSEQLEQFRQYLVLLAETRMNPRLRQRVDASDIVQQTLLEAHEGLAGFNGNSPEQLLAWLRRILSHNLSDARRGLARAKRDIARQISLDQAMDRSSMQLEALAASQSSPSQKAQRHERAVQLAAVMAEMPDAQRQALILQHWHGWSLAEIADHLDRSPAAVAGLLRRGLAHLRTRLQEQESHER